MIIRTTLTGEEVMDIKASIIELEGEISGMKELKSKVLLLEKIIEELLSE